MFESTRAMVAHYRGAVDAGILTETSDGNLEPAADWQASQLDGPGDLSAIDRDDIGRWPELWERTAAGVYD